MLILVISFRASATSLTDNTCTPLNGLARGKRLRFFRSFSASTAMLLDSSASNRSISMPSSEMYLEMTG